MSNKKETPLNPNDFGEVSAFISGALVGYNITRFNLTKDLCFRRYYGEIENLKGDVEEFYLSYLLLRDVEEARKLVEFYAQQLERGSEPKPLKEEKLEEALKLIKEALDD